MVTPKARITEALEAMVVPAAALEERQLPVSAEAMAKRAEIRRASMQQVVLDRERPQGSSEKAPGNCTPEVAEAVFRLRSGSLAARAAVAPGLALA